MERNGGGLGLALTIMAAIWLLCRIVVFASSGGSLLSIDRMFPQRHSRRCLVAVVADAAMRHCPFIAPC